MKTEPEHPSENLPAGRTIGPSQGLRTRSKESATRRAFFHVLSDEAGSLVQALRSIPQFWLEDLPRLPEDVFFQIIPIIPCEVRLAYVAGRVVARMPSPQPCDGARESPMASATIDLFEMNSVCFRLLNRFDGRRTLDQIAHEVAATENSANTNSDGWNVATVRVQLRQLFLQLVEKRVCLPRNPVG